MVFCLNWELPSDILKTVYYSLFDTCLHYACQVWEQSNSDTLVMVQRAQNKALQLINFKEERHPINQSITIYSGQRNIYIYIYKSKLLSRANWILCIGTSENSR